MNEFDRAAFRGLALVCPRDHTELETRGSHLYCHDGHRYEVVDEIPVLLLSEASPTHAYCEASLRGFPEPTSGQSLRVSGDGLDPFVRSELVKTCGNLYRSARLARYPIPRFPLSVHRSGDRLLDIGCNWGRWSLAAGRSGFSPVGIDPSLEAVFAARRVASQLGVAAWFLVADARYLPFPSDSHDVSFSYSVLQHFSKPDAVKAISEMGRVTRDDGTVMIQMANRWGLRQRMNQLRQFIVRNQNPFRVRYWTPSELLDACRILLPQGRPELSADAFLSLNAQPSDLDLLQRRERTIVRVSEWLKRLTEDLPALLNVADSLFITAGNDR